MARAIGIELGAASLMAACVDDAGAVRVLPDRENAERTPAVAAWVNDRLVVGSPAADRRTAVPWDVADAIRLLVGRAFTDEVVQRAAKRMACKLEPPPAGKDTEVRVSIGDRTYTPAQLMAALLKKVREDASLRLSEPVGAAVIAVPAGFDAHQRAVCAAAARAAGIEEPALVDAPAAAAMAFGLDAHVDDKRRSVLVYHLEDTSFEASVLGIEQGRITLVSTYSDAWQGGEVFTRHLAAEISRRIHRGEDAAFGIRLERALHEGIGALASQDSVRITVPGADAAGDAVRYDLMRSLLDEATSPDYERTMALAGMAVGKAGDGLKFDTLDHVLLVGESPYVPLLRKIFIKRFGRKRLPSTVEPARAIAYGAALAAAGNRVVQLPAEASGGTSIEMPDLAPAAVTLEPAEAAALPVIDDDWAPAATDEPSPRWFGLPGRAGALADRQYLAALAATGRRDELQRLAEQEAPAAGALARHYLAVVLAAEGKRDEAIEHVCEAVSVKPDHDDARRLAFLLLKHRAEEAAARGDWPAVAQAVTDALLFGPPGPETADALDQFKHTVPIGHLRSGNREKAADAWQQRFAEHPDDAGILHSLALLHYWWARSLETDGQRCPVDHWKRAVAYWALLVNVDAFWTAWADKRTRRWGIELGGADLETLRNSVLDERFLHMFQSAADQGAQTADQQRQADYEACLTALALERESSSWWRKSLGYLKDADVPSPVLKLPGGAQFFRQQGLERDVVRVAGRLDSSSQEAATCGVRVRLLFSESDLGSALVLAESRNRPEQALAIVNALPDSAKSAADAHYVKAVALVAQGGMQAGQGQYAQAMGVWEQAHALCVEHRDGGGGKGKRQAAASDAAFGPAFAALAAELGRQVTRYAKKEAERLKADEKIEEAIEVVDRALKIGSDDSLKELLCVALCDRAHGFLKKEQYQKARADFERALSLKSDYDRARQGLATTYNNEGVDASDPDTAIRLLRKAFELHPDGSNVRRNLAMALRTKAVRRANSLSQYNARSAIGDIVDLLEEAVKLVGTRLKDDALSTIRMMAEIDASMAEKLVANIDDELLKAILGDLITVYKIRKQVRGY